MTEKIALLLTSMKAKKLSKFLLPIVVMSRRYYKFQGDRSLQVPLIP